MCHLSTTIQSYHDGQLENKPFEDFWEENGILHYLSSQRKLQQNGVVEKKNISLSNMARTMIHKTSVSRHFWTKKNILYAIFGIDSTSDLF